MLGLAVLVSVAGVAQSQLAQSSAKSRAPLRAVLYLTAPVRPGALAGRPAPQRVLHGRAAVRRDLAALAWARADAAVVPWAAPGSAAGARLAALLVAISSTRAHVRVAALIDRPSGTEAAQLHALVTSWARSRSYLRVGSKIVVFVAFADRSLRGCARASRWRRASRGLWLVQATFPGHDRCRGAADAWFRDTTDTRSTRAGGTFLIRPGFWPRGSRSETLKRSPSAWQRSIQRMTVSGEPLQLIDSLDDWVHGTAIEASAAWPSESGFGSYLDALHAQPPGVVAPGGGTPGSGTPGGTPGGGTPGGGPPTLGAPTVDAVAVSGVTANEATLTSVVSAGSASATWQVEFGPTIAYGQTTAPVMLAAGSPRGAVSTFFPISPPRRSHARIVVVSSAGSASVRLGVHDARSAPGRARGGGRRHRLRSGVARVQRRCRGPRRVSADGCSGAILAGAYSRRAPARRPAVRKRHRERVRGLLQPQLGAFQGDHPPAIGNHEYGTPTLAYFHIPVQQPATRRRATTPTSWASWCDRDHHFDSPAHRWLRYRLRQETWVRADLAAHPARCTLAYFHHPGSRGPSRRRREMSAIWSDLGQLRHGASAHRPRPRIRAFRRRTPQEGADEVHGHASCCRHGRRGTIIHSKRRSSQTAKCENNTSSDSSHSPSRPAAFLEIHLRAIGRLQRQRQCIVPLTDTATGLRASDEKSR